jgi:hypothetical protein
MVLLLELNLQRTKVHIVHAPVSVAQTVPHFSIFQVRPIIQKEIVINTVALALL